MVSDEVCVMKLPYADLLKPVFWFNKSFTLIEALSCSDFRNFRDIEAFHINLLKFSLNDAVASVNW